MARFLRKVANFIEPINVGIVPHYIKYRFARDFRGILSVADHDEVSLLETKNAVEGAFGPSDRNESFDKFRSRTAIVFGIFGAAYLFNETAQKEPVYESNRPHLMDLTLTGTKWFLIGWFAHITLPIIAVSRGLEFGWKRLSKYYEEKRAERWRSPKKY